MPSPYPDISGIISAKEKRRRTLAALSWEEKVAIVEQMRRLRPKDLWEDDPASPHPAAVTSVTSDA
jgi:hypothetical protein